MPGSSYLNCRCAVSTFVAKAQPILNVISEESRKVLEEARILPLFSIPIIPQNIPLLYFLICSYNREKQAFKLGNFYVSLTVNEVALILGLPNKGIEFSFGRRLFARVTQKALTEEMKELVAEEWSPTLERRRVDILARYLIVVFLFPQMGLKIPASLMSIKGARHFVKYNWPKAVHHHMHEQLAELSGQSALRPVHENLGNFEGCSVMVVVWLYEHTKLQLVVDDSARPGICRWSSTLSYNVKACSMHFRNLRIEDQVRVKFTVITPAESELLGDEEESDFELVKEKKPKVSTFYKDAQKALPSDMLTWKIEPVDKISKQQGGTDCGVFVLKYMEAALSPSEIVWENHKD